ncbi:MAG: HD domain-containing protein [Planctomycetota bacterium]|nr:MAG: HD domain-containing protein [Planctomycetota bacterium]
MHTRSLVVRDAVWGDISLAAPLVDLLDTPELQRLRGIRQLGTAHLVYPSANHTRFEHVLGTCHVALRILAGLNERQPELGLDERFALEVGAAALVHDVGHVPFGHTFEDERRLFPRHDGAERTRRFLGDTCLGERLRAAGMSDAVLAALGAAAPTVHTSLARDIVAGTLCADLLDYLARDAHFTGIRRVYDERLFRTFAVREGRLAVCLAKRGLPREDAHSEVVHLLRLRYTLSERVYYHHAKVASGALVSKLVERAVAAGLTLEDLYPLGDETLIELLARRYGPGDPIVARGVDDLRARRLPKRAYVLTRTIGSARQGELIARFHADAEARARCERQLEEALDLPPGAVIVYCPGPDMALKEADIPVEVADGRLCTLSSLNLREVDDLLEKHRDLWKFYVLIAARHADRRAALAAACEERFGIPNALALA